MRNPFILIWNVCCVCSLIKYLKWIFFTIIQYHFSYIQPRYLPTDCTILDSLGSLTHPLLATRTLTLSCLWQAWADLALINQSFRYRWNLKPQGLASGWPPGEREVFRALGGICCALKREYLDWSWITMCKYAYLKSTEVVRTLLHWGTNGL